MFRKFVFAVLICVTTAAPAAAPTKKQAPRSVAPKPLPVFDFMGVNTEDTYSAPSVSGKACSTSGAKSDCSFYDNPKLGNATTSWISIQFYNGRLTTVIGSAKKWAYGELLSAFTAKYGQPTLANEKWQNGAGATFDNTVATWRFKGGKLELRQLGSRLSDTDFMFISSENAEPVKAPPVNF